MLPKLQSHLSPDQVNLLVGRWIAEIDPSDVDGAVGALQLLDGAPPAFAEAATARLRSSGALERVFEKADDPKKDALRNAAVINQNGLRDLLWQDVLRGLAPALATGRDENILPVLPNVDFMPSLPAPIAKALLEKLEDDGFAGQSRGEIGKLLIGKWRSLKSEAPRLRSWLGQAAGSPGAMLRKQIARSVLLLNSEALPAADLLTVLNEGAPDAQLAALDRLKSAEPKLWARLYEQVDQATALSLWDSATLQRFIETGGETQAAALERWSAAEKGSKGSTAAVNCKDLPWRLSLLSRQTAPREARFAILWNLLTKRSSCQDDFSTAVDAAFLAVGGEDLEKLVLAAVDRDGPGLLANAPLRLPSVSHAVGETLEARLARGDMSGARRLLDIGAVPTRAGLERRGYWIGLYGPQPGREPTVVDFRVLQAVDEAPQSAVAAAGRIAKDEAAGAPLRSAALLALAAHPGIDLRVFIDALSASSAAVSRPALILLLRFYKAASNPKGAPLPDADLLSIVRTRPDLKGEPALLLQSLARYDRSFAVEFVNSLTSDDWRQRPGALCFALAEASVVIVSVNASALNALPLAKANDRDAVLACVAILNGADQPAARLAHAWRGRSAADPSALLKGIATLWDDEAFRNALDPQVTAEIAHIVGVALRDLPFDPTTLQTLAHWREKLAGSAPDEAKAIGSELWKRWFLAGLMALPLALAAHLALWAVLLTLYPRWPWIQAVVFWNPWVRNLLGLGYVDFVLLHVGFARRRLFAPFQAPLLGDILAESLTQFDRIAYFRDSRVRHRPSVSGWGPRAETSELPILDALARHRGRVLLIGKSGLGKSSFLRFSLARRARDGRDIIAYLRADQCRQGVETEIDARMNGLGREQNLLKAMIHSGRIFIYIDGYNEVDLATQDQITGFLSRYPNANILVASQIPLRGFGAIESFALLPLGPDAIRAFLLSRESVLAEKAPVRGRLYEKVALGFLDGVASNALDDAERKAFDEILSNPMDLTSVAILLGDGRTPDLFALEAQQFEGIASRLAESGAVFRRDAFAAALLQQRLQDQENLQKLQFQPEVVALIEGKLAMVRTDADVAGAVASQEVRFRHDRIRDFFTHFAFLALDEETRAKYAEDTRFAGVFPYLARALPSVEAEALRERLIARAAEVEDHRISDSFVREYSWRQKLSGRDPAWMLGYDLPEAREADSRMADLAERRQRLDADWSAQREIIAKARDMTRILAAGDANALRDAAIEILCELGAVRKAGDGGAVRGLLTSPEKQDLRVIGLAQPGRIMGYHVEVVAVRARAADIDFLVVTNSCVQLDPTERPPDLEDAGLAMLEHAGARVISARDLYADFVSARAAGTVTDFWRRSCLPGIGPEKDRLDA